MRFLQSLHNYDLYTFDWCLRCRHLQQLTTVSRWISKSADGQLYAVLILILLIAEHHTIVALLLGAFLTERVLYFVLKSYFRRNRPPQAIPGFQSVVQPSDQFSFPSGHTSAAFLVTALLSAAVPLLSWVLYPWAACVGISRVLLGVHFPTDTLAGAVLGQSIASLAIVYTGIL